jgi:hypothetical protein
MQKFRIEITEILQKVVEVEALSIESAFEVVELIYKSEEIVLDNSDFVEYKICTLK